MPQFPEKDSLLLSKLYKTAPWMAKLHEVKDESEVKSEGTKRSGSEEAPSFSDHIYGM